MSAEQNYDPFSGFLDAKPSASVAKKSSGSVKKTSGGGSTNATTGGATGGGGWVVYNAAGANKKPKELLALKRQKRARDAPPQDDGKDAPMSSEEWRAAHNIAMSGDFIPDPFQKFSHLPAWTKGLQKSFAEQGFTAPTPIQAQAWPIVLAGRDIVGIAKTGSGKTLAFMVPAIQFLQDPAITANRVGPVVLVLAPTRELAQQISDETMKVVPPSVSTVCIFGGTPKRPQAEELKKLPEIVIATPGRLIDFVEGKVCSLESVKYLVLDEADRMLDMGFEPQVQAVCKKIPDAAGRQTLMFSATWPKEVQKLAKQFQKDIVQLHIGSTELRANPDITQKFLFLQNDQEKVAELRKLVVSRPDNRIIVFVNMKSTADALDQQLRKSGIESQAIHGEKDQAQRDYILNRFKTKSQGVLVATDVAARGIDIKLLEVVVNFDFPGTLDDYVHRIGRTGRAGAKGLAVTLIGGREKNLQPHVAARLKTLLSTAGQPVPMQIQEKADMAALVQKPMIQRSGNGPVIKYKHGSKPSVAQRAGSEGETKKKQPSSSSAAPTKNAAPRMLFGRKV